MSTSVRADILLKISSDLADLRKAQGEIGKVSMSLGDMAKAGGIAGAAFSAVSAGLSAMQSAMKTFITDGVKFNATLETSKLGVASVLKQFDPQKYANFNDAIKDSGVVINALKKEALLTTATFEELLVAYQGTAGAMASAGIPLQKQVGLITNISQAMGALGIRTEEMRQEATALLMGNIDKNARLAKTLGITSAQIELAKEQGQLYEFLTSKLAAFAEAGKLASESINGLESNLKDAATQTAADNTKDLTEAYRELLKALTALVKSDGFSAVMKFASAVSRDVVDKATLITSAFTTNDPNKARADAASSAGSELNDARSAGDLAGMRRRAQVQLEVAKRTMREQYEGMGDAGKASGYGQELKASLETDIAAYTKIITLIDKKGEAILAANAKVAAKDTEDEGEKRKLNAAKLITDELEKQSNGDEKKIAQSKYALATEEERLNILNDEGVAAIALYEKRMEAAALTKNDEAGNQAQLALSLALLDIEEKRVKVRKAIDDADKKIAAAMEAKEAKERALAIKDAQLAASKKIAAGDSAVSRLKNDPLALNETKRKGEIALYAEQNKFIAERIDLLNKERKTADDTRRGQIDSEVSGLNTKSDSNSVAIVDAQAKSIGSGATQGAVEYLNSVPDAAGRASNAVMAVASGLENGIGSSLDGLIRRTMTWTQALANIGTSIVSAIISAFAKMAAQWITQQIVMAIAGDAIQAAQIAALAPLALTSALMWAPAATAASIATYGAAAVTGAAMAQSLIWSSAIGLAEGGPVKGAGTGKSDDIPVWLSNGEYVMPAAATSKYRPMLDAMRAGTLSKDELAGAPILSGGGGSSAPTVNNSVNMAFFDSRQSAEQWAKSSDGEAHIVDVAQRNSHKFSG